MHKSPLFYKWIPFNGSIENPLVFIHGYLESHTIWYHLPLDQLQKPILLVDVPGFGKSQLLDDNSTPSIHYFAFEIHQLLQSYSVHNYTIIGHSLGGYIGLELLKLNPFITKTILLNSNFWSDPQPKKRDRTRVADILLKAKNMFINEAIPSLFLDQKKHKRTINELVEEAKKGTAEWYAYASLAMRERADFTSYLKENPDRFDLIHGNEDHLISTQTLEEKCANWKPIHLIADSGHMSLFEKPKEVTDLLNQLTAISR